MYRAERIDAGIQSLIDRQHLRAPPDRNRIRVRGPARQYFRRHSEAYPHHVSGFPSPLDSEPAALLCLIGVRANFRLESCRPVRNAEPDPETGLLFRFDL